MILRLKSKRPFKITMKTKDTTEEHTSTPRKLGKGKFDHEDNAIVIVGNNLGSVEIAFELLSEEVRVEQELAGIDKLFSNLDAIEESYRKHFGDIPPVTERL